ncbi:MAG: PilZ domain-containing protein [Myxococcales bacterium]|nr:PilZ domain-containing protein [Myxococcales bacterium]
MSCEFFTGDVSYRGLYVCTDAPPVLRQLIRIEAVLPPNESLFFSHGMSVYAMGPDNNDDRLPGVGIQFYAQSQANRRIWENFVEHAKENVTGLPDDVIDSVKRLHQRIDARFEVRPHDIDELETLYTRDISQGGTFLETEMPVEVGLTLALTILHPVTRRPFTIDSVVKRYSDEPRGVGVEFVGLNDHRREAFDHFVHNGFAALGSANDPDCQDPDD